MSANSFGKYCGAVLLGLTVSGFDGYALAQDPGWYFSINIGEGNVDASGFDESVVSSVFLGNRLTENSAVEFGYTNLGEFDAEGFRDTGVEIIGLEAAVMGIALPGEDVEIFGRLGLYLWDAEFEMLGEDAGDDDDTSLSFGIGANFRITESISGRIGYTRYDDISDEDVDTLTLGTVAYF